MKSFSTVAVSQIKTNVDMFYYMLDREKLVWMESLAIQVIGYVYTEKKPLAN
jgi:hypothetical protein